MPRLKLSIYHATSLIAIATYMKVKFYLHVNSSSYILITDDCLVLCNSYVITNYSMDISN